MTALKQVTHGRPCDCCLLPARNLHLDKINTKLEISEIEMFLVLILEDGSDKDLSSNSVCTSLNLYVRNIVQKIYHDLYYIRIYPDNLCFQI